MEDVPHKATRSDVQLRLLAEPIARRYASGHRKRSFALACAPLGASKAVGWGERLAAPGAHAGYVTNARTTSEHLFESYLAERDYPEPAYEPDLGVAKRPERSSSAIHHE